MISRLHLQVHVGMYAKLLQVIPATDLPADITSHEDLYSNRRVSG